MWTSKCHVSSGSLAFGNHVSEQNLFGILVVPCNKINVEYILKDHSRAMKFWNFDDADSAIISLSSMSALSFGIVRHM